MPRPNSRNVVHELGLFQGRLGFPRALLDVGLAQGKAGTETALAPCGEVCRPRSLARGGRLSAGRTLRELRSNRAWRRAADWRGALRGGAVARGQGKGRPGAAARAQAYRHHAGDGGGGSVGIPVEEVLAYSGRSKRSPRLLLEYRDNLRDRQGELAALVAGGAGDPIVSARSRGQQ
jgi:hypothetical protein